MKKRFILPFAIVTVICISTGNQFGAEPKGNVAYASNDIINAGELDNNSAAMATGNLKNNANIEPEAPAKVNNTGTGQTAVVNPGDIAPETYNGLIDELMKVGDRSNHPDHKVKIDGMIRYHYAANNGPGPLDRDSSGIRARLGAETDINKDWRAYGMLEGKTSLVNYDNSLKLERLYAAGKAGAAMVTAGSFGYNMAEGNIYDSGFTGVRIDFGEPVKYTLSYGQTDDTKETSIATARYNDFDYNLEASVYNYQMDNGDCNHNTIWTLGGNYNFSNFSVGAMHLGSSLKDSKGDGNGHVFSLNYGQLKEYRPGTYSMFTKYYNQPRNTYIAHGMNGIGTSMQGFKGYGAGIYYTLASDFVAGIEYYDLTDKISGNKGQTWWCELTEYF